MTTLTQPRPRLSRAIPGFDEPRLRLFDADEYFAMRDAGIFAEDEYLELIGGEILFRHPEVGGPERRPFTNAEYHALAEVGVLGPDERVQLIAGDIIVMSPVGNRHAACVALIDDAFTPLRLVPARACIRVQSPLVMPDSSEPEPDAMLLVWREDRYAFRAPHPEDVLLLVEVSDSTLGYDRDVKMSLYAAAGVPEAWLVNLRDGWIESNTQPMVDSYRSTRRYALGDTIAPQAFPDLAIPVERIIPPRAEGGEG
ncbi:MAG: Uma2 family endonuclease [Dehalococcoidia bacterium]|nr:Uma2 family endonuclease [Dehalococcoidia bacterium]